MKERHKRYITQFFLEKGERVELLVQDNPDFGIIFSCDGNSIKIEGVPYEIVAERILEWKQLNIKDKYDQELFDAFVSYYFKLRKSLQNSEKN